MNVFESSKIISSLVVAILYILIAFSLRLPVKYKKKVRIYSVAVSLLFVALVVGFSLYSDYSTANQGIAFYYDGLAASYFSMFVPLGALMILMFSKVVMNADIYLNSLKYSITFGTAVVMLGAIVLGYSLFMLTFYGFAP